MDKRIMSEYNYKTVAYNISTEQTSSEREMNAEEETSLDDNDFRNAASLREESGETDHSQMYAMDKFEGDIVMESKMRSMVRMERKLWPNGRIPYVISPKYSKGERAIIAKAIQLFHSQTCIRFVPKESNDRAYLYLVPRRGCFTNLGKIGQKQIVSLSQIGCVGVGTVQHELMHAMGFYHEQSRYDRDNYIKIYPENIMQGASTQFQKATKNQMDTHGEKYDVGSVMHYDSSAFSKNSKPTMVKKNGGMIVPFKLANQNDIRKINKLYKCPQKG
ncbi:zinc metalloproteinase nas-7-like [Brevipalpus obovatus]|uniref:zinc metalloproteinase nas-7-like n=1 Tax=Brevipalpus obovatus TaxID=246614 RepID=UPI003D9E32CA